MKKYLGVLPCLLITTLALSMPASTALAGETVWLDDAVPAGATSLAGGGDAWNWVSANPAPFSGAKANQSTITAGLHEHYFSSASATLSVGTGDVLFAYVYLDPANPPSEIMLHWYNGTWEHRAY
ncbi:MAG TPA: hypothetical protein VK717_10810, partial [Opitutaceae bacterium]|nr:hypothetical protein [Opitutaceae bacterium]